MATVGNLPAHRLAGGEDRLLRFVETDLPALLPGARDRFNRFRDLLTGYTTGYYPYAEFAARVRRRVMGVNEDNDWEEPEPNYDDDAEAGDDGSSDDLPPEEF